MKEFHYRTSDKIELDHESSHSSGAAFVLQGNMKDYATTFYSSKAWKQCRAAYMEKVGGLCEDCLAKGIYTPAELVHHIKEITPENINDPAVTLNWSNLRAVCRECHAAAHGARVRRYKIDELGRVKAK